MRRCIGGRQLKPRVRFACRGHDRHALVSCKTHHRGVLGEAVHEERAYAPVAGTQVRAREKRAANAAVALSFEHRNAELGVVTGPAKMRRTDEVQIVAGDPEHGVALEVDARHVAVNGEGVERHAEAQATILRAQREKMPLEEGALEARQLADEDLHRCPCLTADNTQGLRQLYFTIANAARAALIVSSISATPCAAETNPAS